MSKVPATLDHHTVHLRVCDIGDRGAPLPACEAALTDDERARARRFKFDVHRNRFLRSRAFLRTTIARYCQTEAERLELELEDNGKPFVKNAPVAFNLSHSADVAVLGVARMSEIGVDVECFDRSIEFIDIAKRYYAPSEVARLKKLDRPGQRDLFFRLWTSKEAAMKATGEGLRIDPRTIEVKLTDTLRPARYEGRFHPWHLANEDIQELGATVSIAAPESFKTVWIEDD